MAKSCEDELDSFCFPTEFPFEFDSAESNSSLNSLVKSAASTESDSRDGGDFLAGLTRCFTQFSLHKPLKHNLDTFTQKSNGFTDSYASCNVNRNVNNTWDLIYAAAAAEIARKARQSRANFMDIHGSMQSQPFYLTSVLGHTNPNREEMLKQQLLGMYERQGKMGWQQNKLQQLQQQILDRGRASEFQSCENGHNLLLCEPQSARFDTLHVQNQRKLQQLPATAPAMRTGFAGYQMKKKCAGTGVFLPRTYVNPPEVPKRAEFSTSLLPAKVVQAQLYAQPEPWFKGGHAPYHGSIGGHRNDKLMQQRQILQANEMRLPQEWTY